MFSDDRPQLQQPLSTRNGDQRKHIRIGHSGTVQCISEDQRFSGQAVNISRGGMQIIVNVPDSYHSVRSITFTLPRSNQTLELPCRLVRVNSHDGREQVLGLEFSYQAEAQMLLIENYIREIKKDELSTSAQTTEMRQIPRAQCAINDVEIDREKVQVLSIDNISTEGLLISIRGELKPQETIKLCFCLPGDARRLVLTGLVTYVIQNNFKEISYAGVRLFDLKETIEARIRNFIVSSTSSSVLKSVCERFADTGMSADYRIGDNKRIRRMFNEILAEGNVLNVLFENQLAIYESRLVRLLEAQQQFEITLLTSGSHELHFNASTAYFTYNNGGSHFFKSVVERIEGDAILFRLPQVVFQTEKRSYGRRILEMEPSTWVRLLLPDAVTAGTSFAGTLVDISRRGFLCQVPVPIELRHQFQEKQSIQYTLDKRWQLDNFGQIRHVKELYRVNGNVVLQIGIEAGIVRSTFGYSKINRTEWDVPEPVTASPASLRFDSWAVKYDNSKGQTMAALINATRFPVKAPVVVLPPGFGKKKEALSPFVLTLLTNFSLHNKDLVTIRYDGINRPGESYNSAAKVKRGYEMLDYRVSQGVDDLSTTLDYIYSNPYFVPEKVILVSFSMSAIDARRFLVADMDRRVDYWVSCMGVPSAQSTIRNILGGIDIIANYRMGIANGMMGMLGHLMDMETLARDLVAHNYAYMTDTRRDMARIPMPILWIYGTYDKWVDVNEVIDTMSVGSSGSREVIEVPCGHNMHTSDDAVKAYKIVTSRIYENLHKKAIKALDPDRNEMVRLATYERERLNNQPEIDVEKYWKNYLIGDRETGSGYDFYRNFKEFQQFLDHEARLADLRPGDRLADMGCGTGLLLETMLSRAQSRFGPEDYAEIVAIDLVPEALAKAREKCDRLVESSLGFRSLHIDFRTLNLEPNRFIPVYEFAYNPDLDFEFLRNKIEGLKNIVIDEMLKNNSVVLKRVMRGIVPPASVLSELKAVLAKQTYQAVADFNRAARFIRKRLFRSDLKAQAQAGDNFPLSAADYGALTGRDIRFEVLEFGDHDLDFNYPLEAESFTKIVASLFISYLFNPEYAVAEFYRLLKPGGNILLSSMKPDSDVSMMFTNYTQNQQCCSTTPSKLGDDTNLRGARAMLNEAAALFELEQEGIFSFFTAAELVSLCERPGFKAVEVQRSLGNPPQAIIVTARKP